MNTYFYKITMISKHMILFCSLCFPAGTVMLINAFVQSCGNIMIYLIIATKGYLFDLYKSPGLFSLVLSFLLCLLLYGLNLV